MWWNSLYFSKCWEKIQSRVFLWKRSILQRKHFWKIQMICIVNGSKLCISLSIKWLMCACGNFFKVFDSVRLKNVHQLQQYIFTCWTLHVCFPLYWCYLFVNVILPFWGEEFLGSWRRRKEEDSFQMSWWYFEATSWNNCRFEDLIILYDNSKFYVLCAAGVFCWIM